MKILLTGAGGMLGADLAAALDAHELAAYTRAELDICAPKEVADAVAALRPELIINSAAYTRVDDCETNSELAYAVNATGVKNLTDAAARVNAGILHVSTDYVFDGAKGGSYTEDDSVNPLSVYGGSKLKGEDYARGYARHYIVRTQWLYGHNGGSFVKTMLRLAQTRDELRVVSDQIGSPTNTRDLARAIAELVTTGAYGTYHITNSGHTSWHNFAKEIFELSGIRIRLMPCTTAEYPLPARRPAFSPLENRNWHRLGKAPLRHYRAALAEFLAELHFV